jgi:hypothetical protein
MGVGAGAVLIRGEMGQVEDADSADARWKMKQLGTKHHSQPDIAFVPDPRPRHLRALTLIPDPHVPSIHLEVPLEPLGDVPS